MELPISDLITNRMASLGLDRTALGLRLGYTNPVKAAGRVQALCDGFLTSPQNLRALQRLPDALEVPKERVESAVTATRAVFEERERKREERARHERDVEDAEWRASFEPHAVIVTESSRPSSLTMCALSGGPERWIIIPFEAGSSPVTFVRQAVEAARVMTNLADDGRRYVSFYGEARGLIVNYSVDAAVICDLDGAPMETLMEAYRPGPVGLAFGGRPDRGKVLLRLMQRP